MGSMELFGWAPWAPCLYDDVEVVHAGHHSAVVDHDVAQVHSRLRPDGSDVEASAMASGFGFSKAPGRRACVSPAGAVRRCRAGKSV